MKVYLFRHGQTDWNAEKRCQGWSQNALSDLGIAQVRGAVDAVSGLGAQHFYCSDLLRARQSAEILNERLNLPIIFDARLRETSSGDLEGLKKRELPYLDDYRKNPHKYNAETWHDVFLRAGSFVDELRGSGKNNVLIVGHGKMFNVLMFYAREGHWNEADFLKAWKAIGNAEILEFDLKTKQKIGAKDGTGLEPRLQ